MVDSPPNGGSKSRTDRFYLANFVLFLDRDRSGLVLRAIQASIRPHHQIASARDMALARTLGALCGVAVLTLLFISFGRRLLRWTKTPHLNAPEDLLLSAAAGVIAFEAAAAIIAFTGGLRIGLGALILSLAIAAIPEVGGVLREILAMFRAMKPSGIGKALIAGVAVTLLLQGVAAAAPLTGSDALHYHFTTARAYLVDGFHPNFSYVESFYFGQSHELILTGLSLGSEKFALVLMYLAGVLAAGGVGCVTRRWAPRPWGWLAVLAFLLTPIVFWQMTTSGTPDMWMAFFATVAVICISSYRCHPSAALALWAGVLAGGIAGTKYTGCIIAASLGLAFLWEARSLRPLALFFGGALCAGIWPYARNFFWTGDPVFPFGVQFLTPSNVNHFTLTAVMAATGANKHASILKFLSMTMFASFDPSSPGFFQYFGPLCLVFAPLVALTIRNTPTWRAVATVWLASSVGVALTSNGARFLLPVYPIALAASIGSVAQLRKSPWKLAKTLSLVTIGGVLLMGIGGLLIYARYPLAVSAGVMSREEYLRQRGPDYEKAEFVNNALSGKGSSGKALVFFRHTYYLNVPFVFGDPDVNWKIEPEKFHSREAWLDLFHRENIRWVVRAPDYPKAIAASLLELEVSGALAPVAEGQTTDFIGKRMEDVKRTTPIVIFQVRN
jgi:hypothetical protein